MVLSGVATTVKCDNPRCTALYEVSSFLGGHTFTCNKCGSRVTIRDLSFIGGPAQGSVGSHAPEPGQPSFGELVADNWIVILFFAVLIVGVSILMYRNW
jgi:hypothetical protein